MRMMRFLVHFLLVGASAISFACSAPSPGNSESGESEPAAGPGAAEVARAVSAIHAEVMAEVTRRMESAANAQSLLVDLRGYHRETVNRLIGLGRAREGFHRGGKAIVDAAINTSLNRLAPDIMLAFADGQRRFSGDPELARLIADFSAITRYANFDLLREQDPALADEMGIGR
jgi:hypothetical protein